MAMMFASQTASACTNLIVGKGASSNGSVIVSYSADDYGSYGYLFFAPRSKHKRGEMNLSGKCRADTIKNPSRGVSRGVLM
jgi:dipeptidase